MHPARPFIFCAALLIGSASLAQAQTPPPSPVVTSTTISQTPTLTTETTSALPPANSPAATPSSNGTFNAVPATTATTITAAAPAATASPPSLPEMPKHRKSKLATHADITPDDTQITTRTPDVAAQQSQHYGEDHFTQHPGSLSLALLRRADLQPQQFVLHIATDYPITGCARLSGLPHTVEISDKGVMTIAVQDYTVDLRDLPSAPHYACRRQGQVPAADIVLSRDDLIARDIHQIDFKLGQGKDSYALIADRAHVSLVPDGRSMMMGGRRFHARPGGSLTHWFYPPGTVILYAQGAGGADSRPAVEMVARNLGLRPLTESWPDFSSPLARAGESYYVDKGQYLTKDPGIAQGILAGTGTVSKRIYGLQGDEMAPQPVKIYARAPGSYE